jgi:hypothetical protein
LLVDTPSPPALLFSCGETNHAASRCIIRSVQIWLNYSDARGCVNPKIVCIICKKIMCLS